MLKGKYYQYPELCTEQQLYLNTSGSGFLPRSINRTHKFLTSLGKFKKLILKTKLWTTDFFLQMYTKTHLYTLMML